MEDTKLVACRLCLKIIQNIVFKSLKNIELSMLDILIPDNIYISDGSAICRTCHINLLACYGFKSICLEVNDRRKTLTDEELDYEGTQLSKDRVCSLCFQDIDDEMLREIFLGVKNTLLMIMLERCLPELDNHRTVAVACTKCFKSLEVMFSFVNNCQITEEKIEKFCIAKNLNAQTELKLIDVTKFYQPCSENVNHQQIANSKTSTSGLLISNIKTEPIDEFNYTGTNEEAFENSYISMIPEAPQIDTSIPPNCSKFISSNDFSQVNVKLEPLEDIHEFTGNNSESYFKVGTESCDIDINNAENAQIRKGCSLPSTPSQDEFINTKSNNLEVKRYNILPTWLAEWLKREGLRSSGWSPELMAEVQALRKIVGTHPYQRVAVKFRTAEGGFMRVRIPALINTNINNKSVHGEIQNAELNPEDASGLSDKSKECFVDLERNKHSGQRNEEKPVKRCLSPSSRNYMAPCRDFMKNNKRMKMEEENKSQVEGGLLPPNLCQDPSELVMPDFANLNQALQREPTCSDLDDDSDKKKRECMPSTATQPTYEDNILQSNLRRQSEQAVSGDNISVIKEERLKGDCEPDVENSEEAVTYHPTIRSIGNYHNNSLNELLTSGDASNWSSALLLQLQLAALLREGHFNDINQRPQGISEDGIEVSRARPRLETPDCLPHLAQRLPGKTLYKTKSKKPELYKKITYHKISRAVLMLEPQLVSKYENYIAPYHRCPLGRHGGFCAATIGLAEQIRASRYPWTPEIWQRLEVFFAEGGNYYQKQKLKLSTVAGELVKIDVSPHQLKLNRHNFSEVTDVNEDYFMDDCWRYINSVSESNNWLIDQLLATPEPADWSPILKQRLATLFPKGCPNNNWVKKRLKLDDEKVICLRVSRDMLGLQHTPYKGNHKLLEIERNPLRPLQEFIAPEHHCKFGNHRGFCSLTIGVAEQLQSRQGGVSNPALSQRLAIFLPEGFHHSMRRKVRFHTVSGERFSYTISSSNFCLGDINESFFLDECWDELIASELKHAHTYEQGLSTTNEEKCRNTISLRSATPLPITYLIAVNWLLKHLLATPLPADWSPMLRKRLATLISVNTPNDEWLIPRFITFRGDIFYIRICRQMLRLDKQDTNEHFV